MWSALFDALTAAGVGVAAFQLRLGRQQAANEFEQRYINRYWEFKDAREGNFLESEASRKRNVRLCEDEYELVRSNRLRRRTWALWHPAIVEKLAEFPLRERTGLVERAKQVGGARSLVGQCITADLEGHERHDAHDCPAIFAPLSRDERQAVSLLTRRALDIRRWRARRQLTNRKEEAVEW
ncbi:MAG: hypothetical protein M3423_05865 [Actinomycetota bacterium]|nr:hypothetical protein [Actinomycetota bacterium]